MTHRDIFRVSVEVKVLGHESGSEGYGTVVTQTLTGRLQTTDIVLKKKRGGREHSIYEFRAVPHLQDSFCLQWRPLDGQFDDLLASGGEIADRFLEENTPGGCHGNREGRRRRGETHIPLFCWRRQVR